MAGIGFQLRKILKRRDISSVLEAYGYAALAGSGPWILSILSLAFLGTLLQSWMGAQDLAIFFASVTHVYAFSIILTSPVQLVVTRYAADMDYLGQRDRILSAFLTCLLPVVWMSLAFGFVFFIGFVPGSLLMRFTSAWLLVVVACMWVVGVYLSALKDYTRVLFSYVIGYSVSFSLAWLLAVHMGLVGALLGFAFGHMILLVLLFIALCREVGYARFYEPDVWTGFAKYWDIALCGLLYNVAIWIDKFLQWWLGPGSKQIAGALYASPIYDQAVYLSYMTIIPAMAIFLLKLETDFSQYYEEYFKRLIERASYEELRQIKSRMIDALSAGFRLLVKVQGAVTMILFVFANNILPAFGLSALQAGVFRVVVLAAFLLVVFLSLITILFYLDKRKDALICCAVFCFSNAAVTLWDITIGEQCYGVGLVLGLSVAVALAAVRLWVHLRDLEFEVFTRQPISF